MATNVHFTVHTSSEDEDIYPEHFIFNSSSTALFFMMDMVDIMETIFEEMGSSPMETVLRESMNESSELRKTDTKVDVSTQKYYTTSKTESKCLICMDEYERESWVSVLPKCDHIFHTKCIKEWGKYKQDCPTCREKLQVK